MRFAIFVLQGLKVTLGDGYVGDLDVGSMHFVWYRLLSGGLQRSGTVRRDGTTDQVLISCSMSPVELLGTVDLVGWVFVARPSCRSLVLHLKQSFEAILAVLTHPQSSDVKHAAVVEMALYWSSAGESKFLMFCPQSVWQCSDELVLSCISNKYTSLPSWTSRQSVARFDGDSLKLKNNVNVPHAALIGLGGRENPPNDLIPTYASVFNNTFNDIRS